jgi:hypothetical protein
MMNTIDALKLALEALEDLQRQYSIYPNSFWDWSKGRKAIATTKQALAAPVQSAPSGEPAAWGYIDEYGEVQKFKNPAAHKSAAYDNFQLLFTTPPAQPAPVHHLVPDPVATLYPELYRANWEAMHGKEATPPAAQPAPVQPVAHCGQGPNFCKQCANQQAEWCAAILYRDHNEKPWVHVIQKDLPSGTKLVAYGITEKGQP